MIFLFPYSICKQKWRKLQFGRKVIIDFKSQECSSNNLISFTLRYRIWTLWRFAMQRYAVQLKAGMVEFQFDMSAFNA